MTEVCQTAMFRAKELNSTSSKDELLPSKQGLKPHERLSKPFTGLRVTSGRPVNHCPSFSRSLGIMRSFAHYYLQHMLKSGLTADSSALVPKCRMDTSAPVLNCPDISDLSR